MSKAEDSLMLSLNVFINKQKSKVLFAEADSDAADVLLSFLMLPLGKIVRKLEVSYENQKPAIGSLTTLYRGIANLDINHFCVGGAKQLLLDPRCSLEVECRKLILDITDSIPTKYYRCQISQCPKSDYRNISMYSDIAKCDCGKPLNREKYWRGSYDGGGFTMKESSFIISDDLRVVPIVTGFVQTLKNLGITDTDGAELRSLNLGLDDVIELLKLSLISSTPLTDIVFKNSPIAKPASGILLPHVEKETVSDISKEMMLKVSLQKSTNKFLFAQATDEFVEFLVSFLTIPLGGVAHLLGGKISLKNIDNLYRSVTDLIEHEHFKTPDTKNRLINPKLPHGCISKDPFLPLNQDSPPFHYHKYRWTSSQYETYVKKGKTFIVSDDLTVTPYSIGSSILILNILGIRLSDVEETELHIGLEEGLRILEASLTSTTALTDALIHPMLSKLSEQHQPKSLIRLVGQIV